MTYLSKRMREIREEEARRKNPKLRQALLIELGRQMGPYGVPYPFSWRGRGA